MGSFLVYHYGTGFVVDVDDTKHIIFSLMIGVHQIAAFRRKLIQAESLCVYEGVAHDMAYHMPCYVISAFLREFFGVLFDIHEAEKIIHS